MLSMSDLTRGVIRPPESPADAGLQSQLLALHHMDPSQALQQVVGRVLAARARSDLSHAARLRIIFEFDKAVQRQARTGLERYLSLSATLSPARHALWQIVRRCWATLFETYAESLMAVEADTEALARSEIAELSIRAIRAGTQCIKWDAFHHGPIQPDTWAVLNQAYRLALLADVAQRNVQLRSDRATESTVEREYLRALAFNSLGVDQLDAFRLEVSSRLIQYVLPYLELTEHADAASLQWVDVSGREAPARLLRQSETAGLARFFSGTVASEPLQEMLEQVASGKIPEPLLSAGQADASGGKVASALSHMIRCWSSEPPVRRHRRHVLPGTMLVVPGLQQFALRLAGDPRARTPYAWQLQDASLQGIGADARLDEASDLAVGTLLGMHMPDSATWRVGAVRRVWRSTPGMGRVGVELLGGTPVAAMADDGAGELSVVVLDAPRRGQPTRVLVPGAGLRANAPIYLLGAAPLKLSPLSTLEYGTDHEIRMYLCAG